MQPVTLVARDAELWACEWLRGELALRSEEYAADVFVGNQKPTDHKTRAVVIRRDGGVQRGVFDYPRFGVRVWCDLEQEAADLARLCQALLLSAPRSSAGVCVNTTSLSGPAGVPDESQYLKYFTFEAQLRADYSILPGPR